MNIAWKSSYLRLVTTLIERRKELGWTQEDAALRVGTSRRTFQRWELGEANPSGPELFWWAACLGIEIASGPDLYKWAASLGVEMQRNAEIASNLALSGAGGKA